MAPKASAPAHLVITGKLKGVPKISQDGSAVVVKKTLEAGATVQESFPKRRVRGKQKQLKQLIPAEDVLRTVEELTQAAAGAARAEGDRRVEMVSTYANELLGRELEKASKQIGKERARARFQAGKVAAQKRATKAVRQAMTQQRGSPQRPAPGTPNASERARPTAAPAPRIRVKLEQAQREQLQRERQQREQAQREQAQREQAQREQIERNRREQNQHSNDEVDQRLEQIRRQRPSTIQQHEQQVSELRRLVEQEAHNQRMQRDSDPWTRQHQTRRMRTLNDELDEAVRRLRAAARDRR
jgi:hypothetical protein